MMKSKFKFKSKLSFILILALALVVSLATFASAAIATGVSGTVKNIDTGAAIIGATIFRWYPYGYKRCFRQL